ncbi:hypothetical protein GCM10023142_10140 [Anaerocolumna aminovalerica]|jgi:hypothetical protein|uniref:Uncharacterized protein n=1 Tax=Anaerocolumna aminovalerica TaxID=1527 RepID=A0A1I5I397_9FIRM|nr:hypothetical protein [Anaerocolumna aminovalerica]MBU5332981.1 hypothetical protein [Anaerocolumna aminovalerica]MDU6266111.1 hypothetical protein [Anaerocolumna aminovalerica]SFO54819.1 hypothetical protein SAMN04489757_13828 [Anaerocolumna aminovalerica]
MLFGRKKPGFVKIEESDKDANNISEETIQETTENKTSVNDSDLNSKTGNEAEDSNKTSEKPDLLEFLSSLPDVEDEFADLVEPEDQNEAENEEMTEAMKLADYIRLRSAAGNLTKYASLKKEIEEVDQILMEIKKDEACEDIVYKEGQNDKYYYSKLNMSDNYAMISSLVEDKDLVTTIVNMVRFNSKTYPAPTPVTYFEKHPYYATRPQIERAYTVLSGKEENSDIERFTNNKNVDFLFSTKFMTPKYAKALAHEDDFID